MVIIPRHPGKYKGEFEVEEIIKFMGITFHLSPGLLGLVHDPKLLKRIYKFIEYLYLHNDQEGE